MKRKNMIITTTSTIDGMKILHYRGIISARVVTGTGLFSDFFADFSDVFGGRSNTYQKQLKSIYDEVMDQLMSEAEKVKADAIVGVKIDNDEISGKGKQMFMISAIGTAVSTDRSIDDLDEGHKDEISYERVEYEILKNRLIQKIRTDPSSIPEHLPFFTHNGIAEAMDDIFAFYMNEDMYDDTRDMIVKYFQEMDTKSISFLYEKLHSHKWPIKVLYLIANAGMIDYAKIKDFMMSASLQAKQASLGYVMGKQPRYHQDDIAKMEMFKQFIKSEFPDRGKLLDDEKWQCECGKVNKSSNPYCRSCARDIRGFEENQYGPEEVIAIIESRQRALRNIFNA